MDSFAAFPLDREAALARIIERGLFLGIASDVIVAGEKGDSPSKARRLKTPEEAFHHGGTENTEFFFHWLTANR